MPYRDKYHYHSSTLRFHDRLLRSNHNNFPICKHRHPIEHKRDKDMVLFTSSTLHNVHMDPAIRAPFNMDIASVSGAKKCEGFGIKPTSTTANPPIQL